jgi:hypothetical protein
MFSKAFLFCQHLGFVGSVLLLSIATYIQKCSRLYALITKSSTSASPSTTLSVFILISFPFVFGLVNGKMQEEKGKERKKKKKKTNEVDLKQLSPCREVKTCVLFLNFCNYL